MSHIKNFLKRVFFIPVLCPVYSYADVLQINTSLSSGHYLRGIELADQGPALSLSADWSADNGVFAGAECYIGNAQRFSSFDNACIAYLGYFYSLNKNNALSANATRYNYSGGGPIDWDTNEYSLSWHYRDSLLITATYSDNWLARNAATTALDISYRRPLSNKLTLTSKIGALRPHDAAALDTLYSANLGLEYQLNRWEVALNTNWVDSRSRDNLPFDIDQPELIWSIKYQLY